MSEPRRPDPAPPWTERVRHRLGMVAERRRLWQLSANPVAGPESDDVVAPRLDRRTGLVPGLIAVGSALLALGGLWAWQSWSARSSPPVDDLLPMLVTDGTAVSGGEAPDAGAAPGDAEASSAARGDSPPADTQAAPGGGPGTVQPAGAETTATAIAATGTAVVHVSGAVAAPGVVELSVGARVFEAVELAGGPRPDADLDRVNLAAPVVDGERIHVPAVGEQSIPALVPSARPSAADGDDMADPVLDINAATAEDLEALPGVGPTIAEAIVQTRTDRGPFLSVEELLEVPGIGETKLAQLRPFAVAG